MLTLSLKSGEGMRILSVDSANPGSRILDAIAHIRVFRYNIKESKRCVSGSGVYVVPPGPARNPLRHLAPVRPWGGVSSAV